MKYIIMCGGQYPSWETPRHLLEIDGEPIVARTIRLLKENGIDDIYISASDERFSKYAPLLKHANHYKATDGRILEGRWNEAFYLSEDPTCYLFGDVFFSPEAINTIVEYQTKDIMFFASAPPFSVQYIKPYAEPFALKVADMGRLKKAIEEENRIQDAGRFYRTPIMWELWQVITRGQINVIDYNSYVHINDYTCDVDNIRDLWRLKEAIK